MTTITRKAKVEPDGWLKVQASVELGNQDVDVIIVPRRRSASERVALWRQLCNEVQGLPGMSEITDDDIQKEIEDYRAR